MRTVKPICLIMALALVAVLIGADGANASRAARYKNFALLVDQSFDMNKTFRNQSHNYLARKVSKIFCEELPTDIGLKGAVYEYGLPSNEVRTPQQWAGFNESNFVDAVESMKPRTGKANLSDALRALRDDLSSNGISGNLAVIIVSNGSLSDSDDPVKEAENLKNHYNGTACIYTIQVGKSDRGGKQLQKIREAGGSACGFGTTSGSIDTAGNMEKFIGNAFFGAKEDRDMDGVHNSVDKCPNTPYGASIDDFGCWTIYDIQFDTGKWDIKPKYNDMLEEIASVMNANPEVEITIEGHTDSRGSEESNQVLSEKRAGSVMQFLVNAGVEQARLSAVGKGEYEPIATNDTPEGMAKNRRITFVVKVPNPLRGETKSARKIR